MFTKSTLALASVSALAACASASSSHFTINTDIHYPIEFAVYNPSGAYMTTCSGAAAYNMTYTTKDKTHKSIKSTFDQFGAFWYSSGNATAAYLDVKAVQREIEGYDASKYPGDINFSWEGKSEFDLNTVVGRVQTLYVDVKEGPYTFKSDAESSHIIWVDGKEMSLKHTSKPLTIQGKVAKELNVTIERVAPSQKRTGTLTFQYSQK